MLEKTVILTTETAHENIERQDLFLSDPEYGLVPEKPVFVAGFGALNHYLDHLAGEHGEELALERLGSEVIGGISGSVDIYQSFSLPKHRFLRATPHNAGARIAEIVFDKKLKKLLTN